MPVNSARFRRWRSPLAGLAALAALMVTGGCGGSTNNSSTTQNMGAAVPVANGTATAYITTTNASIPTAIGVVMTLHALDNSPHVVNYPNALPYPLPLPTNINVNIPFHSISLFTTAGHDPQTVFGQPGPYTVPHIHISFSLYTQAERQGIGSRLWGLTPAQFEDPSVFPTFFDSNYDIAPNPVYVPKVQGIPYIDFSSIPPGQELPTLGTVFFSPFLPEFTPPPNTGPFTTEVDYAFFGGQMSSFNLTSNLNQLVTVTGPGGTVTGSVPINVQVPLDMPTYVATSGYYPTTYEITYNSSSQAFTFELGHMVFMQAKDPAGNPLPQVAKG